MNRLHLNTLILISSILILITACTKKEGAWSDNIKLSTKEVHFEAQADSVIITTQGDWWWLNGISLDDKHYDYHNDPTIDLESNNYLVMEENFVVERRNNKTLFVKLYKNSTGKSRTLKISLQAGDYFDGVTIIQASK